MLPRLRRRTSPTRPYPTVTYGEWYDFHDVSSLMSPSPNLTFKVSFCLVCRVHQNHHNYTGPPRCMAVSPKASLIFSFSSKPYGAGSNAAPKVSNGHRFQMNCASHQSGTQIQKHSHFQLSIIVCLSPEWHTVPKCSPLAFNSNLNPWRETAITTPLNHLKSSPNLSAVSCPHIPYITCRWWLGSSPV